MPYTLPMHLIHSEEPTAVVHIVIAFTSEDVLCASIWPFLARNDSLIHAIHPPEHYDYRKPESR